MAGGLSFRRWGRPLLLPRRRLGTLVILFPILERTIVMGDEPAPLTAGAFGEDQKAALGSDG